MFHVTRNFLHSYTDIYTNLNAHAHTHTHTHTHQNGQDSDVRFLFIQLPNVFYSTPYICTLTRVFSVYMFLYVYTSMHSYINKYIFRVPSTSFLFLLTVHRNIFFFFFRCIFIFIFFLILIFNFF